ncbi:MAG: hypothetical protein ACE5D3_04530 [Candidatus Binatia bacterium]
MGFSHADIHEKVALDLANPGANADCFAADLTVKGKMPIVRVSVVPSTGSVVNITETLGAVNNTYALNNGSALTADAMASFDVTAVSGASYNVQFAASQVGNAGVVKKVHLQQFEG